MKKIIGTLIVLIAMLTNHASATCAWVLWEHWYPDDKKSAPADVRRFDKVVEAFEGKRECDSSMASHLRDAKSLYDQHPERKYTVMDNAIYYVDPDTKKIGFTLYRYVCLPDGTKPQ